MEPTQFAKFLSDFIAQAGQFLPPAHHLSAIVRFIGWLLIGYGEVVEFRAFHIRKPLPIPVLIPLWFALALGLLIAWRLRRSTSLSLLKTLSWIPRNPRVQMAIIFVTSIAGRLAYWGTMPAPQPAIQDEFSYLLAADTYAHGRLTNPTPEFWTHFETYHELMHPTYMSKYPPGQGLFLALGEFVFHCPFVGVLLSCALMCVGLYWALAAIMPRRWAFLGGILAAAQISWFSYWDSSYWGGAVAALAGCLLVGSAVRLSRKLAAGQAAMFAFSLILLANTRPYEGLLLALPVTIGLVIRIARVPRQQSLLAPIIFFVLVMTAGISLMAYNNWRVTGHPLDLPYSEHNRQYPQLPLPLIFQRLRGPAAIPVRLQKNNYAAVGLPDYLKTRTIRGYIRKEWNSILQLVHFFVSPALAGCLFIGLSFCWKQPRLRWLWGLLGFMVLGWASEVWLQPHYVAPALPVIFALGMIALRALYAWRRARKTGAVLVTGSLIAVLLASAFRLFLVPVAGLLGEPFITDFANFLKSRESVIEQLRFHPWKSPGTRPLRERL